MRGGLDSIKKPTVKKKKTKKPSGRYCSYPLTQEFYSPRIYLNNAKEGNSIYVYNYSL